ncbi:DUF1028 domain-containing protein [Halobacillus litoralis]|uniref:DUF1028 domain-containing protein n=1 Tax=Halobacillus litoralis TaxID=45668 RepID=UPI001CD52327|nr:DUF1028 domain-containing protein [Halobacillus litoralis]MCA0971363.1 DUF1028 domain-containing protein [Halobacillus litoralis]
MNHTPIIATYSIVACDPQTGEIGVGVQSKFLAVGSVVPWAKAGVGAVATQAFANPTYGPEGLRLLEEGKSVEEVADLLTSKDEQAEERQFGIVDAKGQAVSFTGQDCFDWAGGQTGKHYVAQGNILVSEETVKHMGMAFEETKGTLAERLLAGLKAAQEAGGDRRGKQSAALYVVKEKGGYGGLSDTLVDLRVDEHAEPIKELERLLDLHSLYFGETKAEDIIQMEEVQDEVVEHLIRLGYLDHKPSTEQELMDTFTTYLYTENFEGREQKQGLLDLKVLEYLKQQS